MEIAWGRAIALVIGGFGLLSLALAAYVVVRGWPIAEGKEVGQVAFLALVFLIFGIGTGFLAVWTWRNPIAPQVPAAIADEHSWVVAEFTQDLQECDKRLRQSTGLLWRGWGPVGWAIVGKTVEECQRLVEKAPDSLRHSYGLIESLLSVGRTEEAKIEVMRIGTTGLRDGTRTALWERWFFEVAGGGDQSQLETAVVECLSRVSERGRVLILDQLACRCFMTRPELQRLDLADRFSAEAFRLAPHLVTIQGTRGSVLAELGRLDEAEALLGPVFENATPGINRAYSALYLAVICMRRGQTDKAREFAREARRNEPAGFVGDRLAAEGL